VNSNIFLLQGSLIMVREVAKTSLRVTAHTIALHRIRAVPVCNSTDLSASAGRS
jgi:hypothetical protein